MARPITRSFPGITREEKITRSPGPAWTYLCSPAAMSEMAECVSPWLPVERIIWRAAGSIAELVERDDEPLGHPEVAQLRGDRDVGHHAPAEERDPALVADGQVEELLDAVDVRGEGRHDDAARRLGKPPVEGRAHLGLRARMPRPADIGRVRAEGQHAALAQRGERRIVRLLVVDGVQVELEISRVDDRADRRLDRETDAVGDRVGHADGRDGEAAQLDLVPRPIGAQVGALEHAMLGQAMLGDGERQRRAVHGHVEVAQEVRQRPDVVLVTVGQDHAAEGRTAIAEIGEVGDHVVHPGHLVVREQEPAVDGDHVVARLDEHHVEPDLAQPSERDQAHRGRGRHIDRDGRRAVDGTHGGVVMVPPAPGPTKKQDAGTGAICFAILRCERPGSPHPRN